MLIKKPTDNQADQGERPQQRYADAVAQHIANRCRYESVVLTAEEAGENGGRFCKNP